MGANRWQGTHQPAQKSIRTMPSSTVSSWFSAVRVTVAMAAATLVAPAAFPAAARVTRLTPAGGGRSRAGPDLHGAVLRRGLPRAGIGHVLLAAADVLDLVGGAVGAGEPDEGDAAPVRVADLP